MEVHLSQLKYADPVSGERRDPPGEAPHRAGYAPSVDRQAGMMGNERARRVMEHMIDAGLPRTSRIRFRSEGASNDIIIEVVDTQTEEVLRRIPSDEFRTLLQPVHEKRGMLTDQML
jgi:hypothetical protein